MRVSRSFGDTLREAPADADAVSHQLLLRAGYVRPLATGIFSYLPLGWRSLRKIEQILREEMDAIGGQEINMPVVHPAELWKQTGRWQSIDASLVRFRDRGERDMVLGMTHEEVVAHLAATEIRSYRQLPQLVYQIQTKFRDEPRARGGLIRVREFVMKDSYSLDRDVQGLEVQYQAHYAAYLRIGARAALPLLAVRSDVGMMGGKLAHEFMYVSPIGEDTLALCDGCGYAANRDVARFARTPASNGNPAPLEKVATPGTEAIASLAAFLHVEPSQTAKVVFFVGDYGHDEPARLILGVVRGDMEVNLAQLQSLAQATALRPAHEEEIRAAGAVPGYASPIGIHRDRAWVVADDLVAQTTNLIGGANETGYHFRNTNHGRDYQADRVGPIASVFEGARCAECGAALRLVRGIEVGNIFQLGTRYSDALNAHYLDEQGRKHPILMGSYGIGLGRLLACTAEEHRDEHGLALPISVAPYEVMLVGLWRSEPTRARAEAVYETLQSEGFEVLYDDRDASPGVKFADADLRGIPLRVTVSERSIRDGGVELKRRRGGDARMVPIDGMVAEIRAELAEMWQALTPASGS